jgi:glutamyl-tRNA reductase
VSIAVVGINHRTVALEQLEPLIVAPDALGKALADLASRPHLDEVVLLSTCLRTEVYAVVNRFHGAMADIREFLATWSGKAPDEFSGNLYSYFDEGAVNHLFRVASGLDSASLGEPEVLGQVRQAWEVARREGTSRAVLSDAFRHAVEVGKRARTETNISRGTTSLSHAAVALAARALGSLAGKKALVVGLGEIGEGTARALSTLAGAMPPVLVNRTRARAEKLAAALGSTTVPWESLANELAEADVVFCCTSNKGPVISAESLAAALARTKPGAAGRPLVLVDLSVPRGIARDVAAVEGVLLLDMDDISAFVAEGAGQRRAEVPAVEAIVAEELVRYRASQAARSVSPLLSRARDAAERARRNELTRLEARLQALEPSEREAVELLTRRLVAKLLHTPTIKLKAAAGTPRGEVLAEAFRELFGLQ